MPVLLTTAYFPPIEYFAVMARDMGVSKNSFWGTPDDIIPSSVYIEACENYQKQSYRNRCHFYADNGRQALSFPIVHTNGSHNNISVRDVRIDYSVDWVTRHERAIVSAYRTSAYFDYYAPMLEPFYTRHYEFLADYNTELTRLLLKAAGIDAELRFSEAYVEAAPGDTDLRLKKRESRMVSPRYFQLFSDRWPFVPNLSFLDLLMSEGPSSIGVLRDCRL